MKRYLIWLALLMKRMLKKPAFVLMLIGMPILALAVSKLEQNEGTEALIGIMIETEPQQTELASEAYEEWNQGFMSLLRGQESILTYTIYESKKSLMQDVEKGELDCGFLLPYDLRDKLVAGAWQGAVTVYSSGSSYLTGIAKERIAALAFTMYSEESYVNYVKTAPAFDAVQSEDGSREEIAAFAREAYNAHLLDGSTFGFIYNGDNYDGDSYNGDNYIRDNYNYNGDNGSGNRGNMSEELHKNNIAGRADEIKASGAAFHLRGILAVCIFLSGMCGLLTDCKDRQERRFRRIAPDYVITMVNVFVPTVYTAVVSLAALLMANQLPGAGSFMKELLKLFIYQFMIVVYCSIMRLAFRKQETIAAAIPILTLACMICSPVWIRLAAYLPVFRILEKLFPATYYLLGA